MLLDIFVEMRYILSDFFVKCFVQEIFTVTFDQLNTSLLNNFFLSSKPLNGGVHAYAEKEQAQTHNLFLD